MKKRAMFKALAPEDEPAPLPDAPLDEGPEFVLPDEEPVDSELESHTKAFAEAAGLTDVDVPALGNALKRFVEACGYKKPAKKE